MIKPSPIRIMLAALLLAAQACFAQYNQVSTNIYAPGAGTNFVDFSARPAPNDLVTFSNAVYEAHAADLGGDLYFSANMTAGTTVFRCTYGINNSKRLILTADKPMQAFSPPGGSFWTVSGSPNGYGLANNTDQSSYNLSIGPITNVSTEAEMRTEKVVKLGFVVCSRTHATYPADIKATVSYTDGTTESATATIVAPRTYGDTFYGFTAPAGQAITNLLLEAFDDGTATPVATRVALDDIGFVTESSLPRPPSAGAVYPINGAVHWASNGIQFQVTSPTDVETGGISVVLNSADVSSQLVIGGEPKNRTVSFNGLAPNLKYKLQVGVTNVAGGSVGFTSYFYTPESSTVALFDSGGFTDDLLYPLGPLTTASNNDCYWESSFPSEPAQVVDLADGTYGKVLRRMQGDGDRVEKLAFPPVASGTLILEFNARVSSMDVRSLDMAFAPASGTGSQGPFLMWGTNALHYYDRTAWVPLKSLDIGWHHYQLVGYVSGPKAGTFDLKVDNALVGEALVWRNVFSPVYGLRVGAIRGALTEYGDIDNLLLRVGVEALAALPVTLLDPAHSGTVFSFSFQSLAGINYGIEYKSSLTPGDWTPLETISGDGSIKTVTHNSPPPGTLFYRVISQLP